MQTPSQKEKHLCIFQTLRRVTVFIEQTRSPNVSQVAREKLIEQVVTDWKFHVDVKRKMERERLTGFCKIMKKKNNCIKRCSLSSEKESHMKFIYRMRGNPFLAKGFLLMLYINFMNHAFCTFRFRNKIQFLLKFQ